MPLQIPDGFVNATLSIQLEGDPELMSTSLGWAIETPPFTQANATALLEGMALPVGDLMVNVYVIIGGVVTIGGTDPPVRLEATFSVQGTQGASGAPQNTATLIKKTSAGGGIRNRGRMFVPGVPEGVVNSIGVFSSAALAQFQASVDDLFEVGASAGTNTQQDPVLFHETGPDIPTVLTNLIVDPRVATQRRRLRR